jgi:hypothetical protein
MASLVSERYEWPILDQKESTQSNTFMPWICSVIDEYKVTFPDGYKELFDSTLSEYKRITGDRLPFDNFGQFQHFLKKSVTTQIGEPTSRNFKVLQDGPYHLRGTLQEKIVGGTPHAFDGFFGMFIDNLKKRFTGQTCVVETHRAEERPSVWHYTDNAGKLIPFDEETNTEINLCVERDLPPIFKKIGKFEYLIDPRAKTQLNFQTRTERAIKQLETRPSVKRWYYINDEGEKTPFSEEDNRTIKSVKSGDNPRLNGYELYLDGLFQVNAVGDTQQLVYEGGNKKRKTKRNKRRRSIYNKSRHRA